MGDAVGVHTFYSIDENTKQPIPGKAWNYDYEGGLEDPIVTEIGGDVVAAWPFENPFDVAAMELEDDNDDEAGRKRYRPTARLVKEDECVLATCFV